MKHAEDDKQRALLHLQRKDLSDVVWEDVVAEAIYDERERVLARLKDSALHYGLQSVVQIIASMEEEL